MKRNRERTEELEMEVRGILMAVEHVSNATEMLGEMTSRKFRREN